jgi:hypothetical protein
MKARFTLLAVPLIVGVAFAQSSGSGSTAGSPQSGQSSSQTTPTSTTDQTKVDQTKVDQTKVDQTKVDQTKVDQTKTAESTGKPAEMKTMTYKGTLVDLGCGAAATNTASTSTDANANANANASSANRAAGDSSCAVSASTSQFGLKTDNGQTYRFDMVGNQRAQDEFKNNKRWSNNANKPLKVRISGVVQGDKLIVSSIH